MFERYTEKARRVIFFARYEAAHFGSPYIETEHLLLGLLRENKVIALKLLKDETSVELIRQKVETLTIHGEKFSTSVDLPLSNECKRVLAYAAEEAESLSHRHIGTEHLLLGLLREEKTVAARLLTEAGAILEQARQEIGSWPGESGPSRSVLRPTSETAVVHGRSLPLAVIRAQAKRLNKFAWLRREWKPLDVVVDNQLGGICFDPTVADGKRFQLQPEGWTKEPCALCGWELTTERGPENSEGFTNGRQWLCAECYHRFVAPKSAGAA